VDPGGGLWVEFKGIRRPVCCVGCRAIAVFAITHGLTALYHGRDGNADAA